MNKRAQTVILILLIIVALGIASTTITILHQIIGMPQGAALGVGLAIGTFLVIGGINYIKGLF